MSINITKQLEVTTAYITDAEKVALPEEARLHCLNVPPEPYSYAQSFLELNTWESGKEKYYLDWVL